MQPEQKQELIADCYFKKENKRTTLTKIRTGLLYAGLTGLVGMGFHSTFGIPLPYSKEFWVPILSMMMQVGLIWWGVIFGIQLILETEKEGRKYISSKFDFFQKFKK